MTIDWSSALKTTAGSVAAARPCCSCSTTSRWSTPFRQHGIPQEFLDHAKRDAILERIGLTAQALARGIVEDVTALDRGEGHSGAESDIHVASPVDRGRLD